MVMTLFDGGWTFRKFAYVVVNWRTCMAFGSFLSSRRRLGAR